MAFEQTAANLVQTATNLLAIPTQLAAEFTAGRQAYEASFAARSGVRSVVLWVHPVTGDDANTGATNATPVRTLARALALVPQGAFFDIYGRSGVIRSDSAVRRRLTFGREIVQTVGASGRQSIGFRLGGSASLVLTNLTIAIPPLDGNFTGVAANSYAPMITSGDISAYGAQMVTIAYCDVENSETPFAGLLGGLSLWSLYWFVNTLVGTVTSMNGRVLDGTTSSAGTDPASRSMQTNLTLI
mgnify:CR=1 FL=1